MRRVVVVLSPGRSGSSCVAGVLNHLGIHMGSALLGCNGSNPRGHFEDRDLVLLTRSFVADATHWVSYSPKIVRSAFSSFVTARDRECSVWGVKDPRLCVLGIEFLNALVDEDLQEHACIVVAHRDLEHAAASLARRDGLSFEEALRIIKFRHEKLQAVLAYARRLGIESREVSFPRLVNPATRPFTIGGLQEFVFNQSARLRSAIEFVDPKLMHHYGEESP